MCKGTGGQPALRRLDALASRGFLRFSDLRPRGRTRYAQLRTAALKQLPQVSSRSALSRAGLKSCDARVA